MEKGVSLSMKAEKNMEQDLAPLPFSAPTPLLGQADYMLSGIYPHRKKRQVERSGSSLKKLNKLPPESELPVSVHPKIIPANQKALTQCFQ